MKKTESKLLLDKSKKNDATVRSLKWVSILKDYDNYITEFLKHYKKSLKGDPISLSRYPYLKSKSEDLGNKLHKAQKKELLTEKQLERIKNIKLKIFNVYSQKR